MNISREGIEITKRFFEAIDMLKAQRVIRGLQTFTDQYDINRWNINTVKSQPDKSVLKPEWISYLCRDYNISPTWIILGLGNMFGIRTYNFKIDEANLHVPLKIVESYLGKHCVVTYIPSKRVRAASGLLKNIVFNNKNGSPSIDIKQDKGGNLLIALRSIESIE